jgi:hypothetical protein
MIISRPKFLIEEVGVELRERTNELFELFYSAQKRSLVGQLGLEVFEFMSVEILLITRIVEILLIGW